MEMENNNSDIGFFNNLQWIKTCIEGILFISEGLIKARHIAESLNISEKEVSNVLAVLEKEYISQNRGFILKRIGGGYRMYSNPSISEVLKKFVKTNIRARFSQAAIETLAIIAYRQPVTRTQIAEIRGVRTDSVVITLEEKGLIKEAGKLKEPGNPILYKTTDYFLELLGINSMKDLPQLTDFDDNNDNESQ